MRVLMTGATGFIGRATVLRLQRDGHSVAAWVRSPQRARSLLGPAVDLVAASDGDPALQRAVAEADAVINLAGEPIISFPPRWTARRRAALVDSRVTVTERIVQAIRAAKNPPKVLVSASAVGYYGDRADEVLYEDSKPGTGFMADLCQCWEDEALNAESCGTRVVVARIGIVLGVGGGILQRLMPIFGAGLGGAMGSGRQFVPWIHLSDMVELLVRAMIDTELSGAINATAPTPVDNREFSSNLADALNRPALFRVPRTALRVAMGEAAKVVLASQRVLPARLERSGFSFRFPALSEALTDILNDGCQFSTPAELPDDPYITKTRPLYQMSQITTI
ncbi:MAG: TIGR01777 family oxidoreductase, partial [Myxococcota bacterium]